jgi:hypothetical protein
VSALARLRRRGSGTGEVTLAFCSTSLIMSNSILACPQIGGGGFVDQLMNDRLGLGDLAPLSVDRDEDRLAQRIASTACSFFLAAVAGVAGLPLSETGVQRRPTL